MRRRDYIDLDVGERGLVLEARRRALGFMLNESVLIPMYLALLFRAFALAGALAIPALPLLAGGAPESDVSSDLTAVTWRWQRTLMNDDTSVTPEDPSRYTITFHDDDTVSARVDCNQMGGTYKLAGASISIDLTHGTRAMCPPESFDMEFQREISEVRQVVFDKGQLHFDLVHHRGTMSFGR